MNDDNSKVLLQIFDTHMKVNFIHAYRHTRHVQIHKHCHRQFFNTSGISRQFMQNSSRQLNIV